MMSLQNNSRGQENFEWVSGGTGSGVLVLSRQTAAGTMLQALEQRRIAGSTMTWLHVHVIVGTDSLAACHTSTVRSARVCRVAR